MTLKLLLDLKNRRQNERTELSIGDSVRLVETQLKVEKVVRIRYVGHGWNTEELQGGDVFFQYIPIIEGTAGEDRDGVRPAEN